MVQPRPGLTLRPIWLILPVVGAVVAATLEPIPPYDYWWHLAMGRLIAAHGVVPQANLFLYTMPAEAAFHDQPWLSQWAMYAAYAAGGHGALVWLRNLLLAAAMGLLVHAGWRRGASAMAVGVTGLLAVASAYPVLTVRTRAFAFLPFAALVWIVAGILEGQLRRRWAWALLPVVALWANLHGSFVLAPVLLGAVAVSATIDRRRSAGGVGKGAGFWWLTVLGAVVAGALNPAGFGNYTYVFELAFASDIPQTVSEWQPPELGSPTGLLLAATALVAAVALVRRRSKVRPWEVLWLAGTLYGAATAVRSLFWFAALVPVVVAPHLDASSGRPQAEGVSRPSRAQAALHACLLGALLLAAVSVQPGVALHPVRQLLNDERVLTEGEGADVLNHRHPVGLIEAIRDGDGRIFHDQALGGWLEFHLTTGADPRPVAFVDQRMEMVPAQVWRDYFVLSAAEPGWHRLVARYELRRFVLSRKEQGPLVEALLGGGRWEVRGEDAGYVLVERR